ncbi:uncharacterized protein LOC110063495 [Orbicella faveolata]|uniref:uncharacterized protein LOC110063495 n=1 Tax=Orbicella faveolata TaxID=48498 RepID=UPI0009E2DAE5|nr:uncharacterized protein LOC110063495 [Orbicella faveolata]
MNLKFAVCISFVLTVIKLSNSKQTKGPKCGKIDAKMFPSCAKAGFNFTVDSITYGFFANSFKDIVNGITAKLGDCSNYTSHIVCSLYVPRCKKAMAGPWLPCQEVCWEFVRGCGEKMDVHGLNWMKSLCGLLPSKSKNSGKPDDCFEPPGFINQNSSQDLSCTEAVKNKQCMDAKCTDTFIPEKTQESKDFKDNENSTIVKLRAAVGKDSCKEILTKLACASYTPPCEKDGHMMKSLCRSRCLELFGDCPEAFNGTDVSAYCAAAPGGYADSGFCDLKRWPSAEHWDVGT